MRIFPKQNNKDWICPICNTKEEKEVTLIAIEGTKEGNNIQAELVHLDCLNLTLSYGNNNEILIFQLIRK